ncbi:hypothetical protein [Usitatibacter palustris]|uniref:Uncharacterized protein n=1 Tax=Usitatibacter palustris TaxID=2732487 RepID=A0A6M4H609_9PROT|nr:hypothetical protein [Usitatibacter palustris]QJR14093.1 hypothetical protein DSM104440_00886 [Usitatibacter palustris]
MSEMRRIANLLVAVRPASYPSAHDLDTSIAKLRAAANPASPGEQLRGDIGANGVRLTFSRASGGGVRCAFEGTWIAAGDVFLDGRFVPAGRTTLFLKATSVVLALLFAATVWAWLRDVEVATRVITTLTLLLAIFAFPFAVMAFGSDREVEEIAIAKAIVAALG